MIKLDCTERNDTIIKQMLEEACASAKPVWLGFMCGDNEVHSRLAIYLAMEYTDYYVNVNTVQTDPTPRPQRVDRCCLAKYKSGPPFATGPLEHVRELNAGDSLMVIEGKVRLTGKIPE